MTSLHTDAIAAIATPIGEGGISVIRVSGNEAIGCVDGCFTGRKPLTLSASHTAHHGMFRTTEGAPIDEVVCTLFIAPHSYTGEDVVEISCHGGLYVTRRILQTLFQRGARQALPGEFTKRAFLNGRMDLSQAEAVADLIHARSEKAREASLKQLEGSLSAVVGRLRSNLIDALGLLELELDFAEDGYEFIDRKKVADLLQGSEREVETLLASYNEGRIFNEGVKAVLAGAPNVGKSSLLNALLNEERAIVTDIPGTTRDTIEESISIEGILFRLVDTAGLRETEDLVEQEGVRRSERSIADSDIVLFVVDTTRTMTQAEKHTLETLRKKHGGATIVVANKVDVGTSAQLSDAAPMAMVEVSAKTHKGLGTLRAAMVHAALPAGITGEGSVIVTNSRHYSAFLRTQTSLQMALESLEKGSGSELLAVDIRGALEALEEVIGIITTEDILNAIFSRFCIGK